MKATASFNKPHPYNPSPTVFDVFFSYTLLPLLPKKIKPNHLTILRFIMTPFVLYFLWSGYVLTGLILFCIAALTDALDGALARTEHKITQWGTRYDPFADKLLIGTVAILEVTKYFGWLVVIAMIIPELSIVFTALIRKRTKRVIPAHLTGKVKMILQSFSIVMLLVYPLYQNPALLGLAEIFLWISVFFAVLSVVVYNSL